MTDSKYPASGSIRFWWIAANGVANPLAPTEAEIQAGLDISDAISWNDKDFGFSASNTTSDPAITATGNTQNRGAAQYGGSLSFYYPATFGDDSNLYSVVWDALHRPGTAGFLIGRIDGREQALATGTPDRPGWTPEDGDLVSVYKVETAGYSEQIVGEEAFRYTISFLPKGTAAPWTIVRPSATPAIPVITAPATLAAGEYGIVTVKLLGREYTRAVVLTTSDPDLATVSKNGVISAKGAGTVTITAKDPATGASATEDIVIS